MKKRNLILPIMTSLLLISCGPTSKLTTSQTNTTSAVPTTDVISTNTTEDTNISKSDTATTVEDVSNDINQSTTEITTNQNSTGDDKTSIENTQYTLEDFLIFRENTVGEGKAYSYTYKIEAFLDNVLTPKMNGLTDNAIATFIPTNNLKFYDVHTNSRSLFYDGTTHTFYKDNTLYEVKYDQDNDVTSSSEEIDFSETEGTSVFPSLTKALFKMEEKDMLSLNYDNNDDSYILKANNMTENLADSINELVNSVYVQTLLPLLSDGEGESIIKFRFTDGKISEYLYNFDLTMMGTTFNLTYSLEFVDYNPVEIVLPDFSSIAF